MQDITSPLFAIAAFIVGFPLFWMAILFLTSHISGWAGLANQFPAEGPIIGDTFRWSSARFGLFSNYGNCIFVTVSSTGIHLRLLMIFRAGHKPIMIPWRAVEELKQSNHLLFTTTKLTIKNRKTGWLTTISLYGKPLAASLEKHDKPN